MGHAPLRIALRVGFFFAVVSTVTTLGPITATGAQKGQDKVRRVKSPDGVSIAYEVHGKGTPALVFVHGWSCDRSYWAQQLGPFSRQFTVVAIDLAGHGESGLGRKQWTIESFGEDVAAVVKKLGLRSVILVGHSMGGDVVPEAARRLPGRVKGMVWVDTYKQLGQGRSPEQVRAFVDKFRPDFKATTVEVVRSMFPQNSDQKLVERVAQDMSSAPPRVALAALESAFNYSRVMPRTLEELKLPVIAINPDDTPTDIASMNRYGVEVMIMPGVGHFLHMEDPERFNGLLMNAVAKLKK
jgi:pimeloyl-ACP methyl ester carboxylesterase